MLKSYLLNIEKNIKSGEIDVNKILNMAIEVSYVSDEENKKEKEFLDFLDRLLPNETKKELKRFFFSYFLIFQNDFYIPDGEEDERSQYLDKWMEKSYIEIKNYLLNIINFLIMKETEKEKDIEKQAYIADRIKETFFDFRY